AYKILNETPTGAMIEDLLAQVVDRTPLALSGPIGADVVAGVEHILRNGAVLALNHDATPGAKSPFQGVVVLKGAARKDTRALFGRLVWLVMGKGNKPQAVAKGARKVVVVPTPSGGSWIWWAEKEDLVFAPGGEADFDAIVATIDGKRPSAVDHP